MICKKQVASRIDVLPRAIIDQLAVTVDGMLVIDQDRASLLTPVEKRSVREYLERTLSETYELARDRTMLTLLDSEKSFWGTTMQEHFRYACINFWMQVLDRDKLFSNEHIDDLDTLKSGIKEYLRVKYGDCLEPYNISSEEASYSFVVPGSCSAQNAEQIKSYMLFLNDVLAVCDSEYRFVESVMPIEVQGRLHLVPYFQCGCRSSQKSWAADGVEVVVMKTSITSPVFPGIGTFDGRRIVVVEEFLLAFYYLIAVQVYYTVSHGESLPGVDRYVYGFLQETLGRSKDIELREILETIVSLMIQIIPYHEMGHIVVDRMSQEDEKILFAPYQGYFIYFSELMANFAPSRGSCSGLFAYVHKLSKGSDDERKLVKKILSTELLYMNLTTYKHTLQGKLELDVINAVYPVVDSDGKRELNDDNFDMLMNSDLFPALFVIYKSCCEYVKREQPGVDDFGRFMEVKWRKVEAVFAMLMAQMKP